MSSGPVGKFQDHYKIFAVDPKASTDEIHAAYRKQIELYHPERGTSPDREKYDAAQLAFEVLSDPDGRKAFDAVRGGGEDEAEVYFSGLSFFDSMRFDVDRRNAILVVLYDHKRQKPRTPSITRRQLDMMINMSEEDVQLAIWYLKDRGMMIVDDRSKMQITAAGMDYLQAHLPNPRTIFPFLKAKLDEPVDASTSQTPAAPAPVLAPEPPLTQPATAQPQAAHPQVAEPPSPRVLNLTPMTNLANLASSLGASTAPAPPQPEELPTPPPAPTPEAKPAPVGLNVEAGKPRPINIVRRSLTLP